MAHDALEDGNHNKYGDRPLEGKNKESKNDLGIKTGIEPGNENHVNHGAYAYMDLEGENKHEKNAYHNEEPNPDMSLDYYYNSKDRVTISSKHIDNAKSHVDSENSTSTELSYECLIETDTMNGKTRVQRTLSNMKETLKQRSDDPKRGGKMGTDVKIGEGTKIVEVNHEHRTNIINETNEARTTEFATGFPHSLRP